MIIQIYAKVSKNIKIYVSSAFFILVSACLNKSNNIWSSSPLAGIFFAKIIECIVRNCIHGEKHLFNAVSVTPLSTIFQ
jgi:hypothetical protein